MPARIVDNDDPEAQPLVAFTHAFRTVRILVFAVILVVPPALAIGFTLVLQNVRDQAKDAYVTACHDVNDLKTQIVGLLDEGLKRAQTALNAAEAANAPKVQIDAAKDNLTKAQKNRNFVNRSLPRKNCNTYPPPPSPNTKSNSKQGS